MQWSEWIECVLKERKEGSSWSVEVVVIAGLGRHFQLAGCRLLTARWDSVGCGEYVVQCMQFTDIRDLGSRRYSNNCWIFRYMADM